MNNMIKYNYLKLCNSEENTDGKFSSGLETEEQGKKSHLSEKKNIFLKCDVIHDRKQ